MLGAAVMSVTGIHKEDIKAALRKRHGTVAAFASARGLKAQQVRDWLRGRTSAAVAEQVVRELGVVQVQHGESINVDDSRASCTSHRLNAGDR